MLESYDIKNRKDSKSSFKGTDGGGFGMNSGLGLDCRLSHTWSLQCEATAANIFDGFGNNYWAFIGRIGLTRNF